jgi:hypothetical protein
MYYIPFFPDVTNFFVDICVFVNPSKVCFLDYFSPHACRKKFQGLFVRPYVSFVRHFPRKTQAFLLNFADIKQCELNRLTPARMANILF